MQAWKEFPKCRLCLSAFSILCLAGTESKEYQVICVLPVFSPISDQNQIYKKSGWWIFFFTKLCLCLLPDLPKAFYSPAGPTPMTKFRLFCPTRIFPFLRNAIPFQSMSNPADILYKKGKMVISVLWGIKKRSNRFWNLKAFLKKIQTVFRGSPSDTS